MSPPSRMNIIVAMPAGYIERVDEILGLRGALIELGHKLLFNK